MRRQWQTRQLHIHYRTGIWCHTCQLSMLHWHTFTQWPSYTYTSATIQATEASASVKFTSSGCVSWTYHKSLPRSEAEYFTKLMLGLLIVSLIVNSAMKNASLLQQSSVWVKYGSEFTIVRTCLSDKAWHHQQCSYPWLRPLPLTQKQIHTNIHKHTCTIIL